MREMVKHHTPPSQRCKMASPPSPTKRKLIDAAHALIWANSYGQVSVEDICNAAGVQKGSFYHFFPSKSELTAAALEDCWYRAKAELDGSFEVKRAPRAQLKEICRLVLDEQKKSLATHGVVCGCPYALVAAEVGSSNKYLQMRAEEMSALYCGYLERVLTNAACKKLIPRAGIARTAREMHIYIMGAMLEARLTNSLQAVGKDLERALLRLSGIGA
jgi:TetR/AcrR family transcriptional repressor of nem operon